MKTIYINRINLSFKVLLVSTAIVFTSCKTDFYEDPSKAQPQGGSLDVTRYVAIGSTISAGFADNALYTEAQQAAYPNLLAQKFKEVNNGIIFNQPDINSEQGWSGATKGKFRLSVPACSTISISPAAQDGESAIFPYNGDKSALSNLSVPFLPTSFINSATVAEGSNFNQPKPYFDRIVSGGTKGISSEAKKRNPTFFSIWLGYVDALQYATSGGTKPLLSTGDFKLQIEAVLDSVLAGTNSKGLIATIPYVDLFPTITNNNRRLTSATDPAKSPIRLTQAQADEYNTSLGSAYFSGAAGNSNNFVIKTGTGTIRQLSPSKDFIVRGNVLDSVGIGERDPNSVRGCEANHTPRNEVGLRIPIHNNAVLDVEEIKVLRMQIDEYNQAIREVVNTRNTSGIRVAVVDLNAFYTKLTDPLVGIQYGSSVIRANHPNLGPDFGGFYSLDRTHPTPKGQALIANEFIRVINSVFGATLNLLNPDEFRANQIPSNNEG